MQTRTGEISVQAREFHVLSKALRPLPEKWHGLQDVETRYRKRYLDLIANPEVMEVFRTRGRIVHEVRAFLVERGFLEVETPVLQTVPGGGSARPFETYYNALDRTLSLRIALELYLKRCIIGGIERVFEIGRNFRNEGISLKHNPEFTMLEVYQAYADYEDIMRLTEDLVSTVAQRVLGTTKVTVKGDVEIDLAPPWERKPLRDAIYEASGVDYDEHLDGRVAGPGGERGRPAGPGRLDARQDHRRAAERLRRAEDHQPGLPGGLPAGALAAGEAAHRSARRSWSASRRSAAAWRSPTPSAS